MPRPFRVFVTLYASRCCNCILSKTSQGADKGRLAVVDVSGCAENKVAFAVVHDAASSRPSSEEPELRESPRLV